MRRPLDAVLVAAVAAVALAAVWDVLGREEAAAPPGTAAAEGLRALGASGEILFSDGECRRSRLDLLTLETVEIPRITGCRVFGHRGSLGVVAGEVGWYAYPGGATMLLTRPQLAAALGGGRVVAAAWLAHTRFAALVELPGAEGPVLALFDRARLERVVGELDPSHRELRSSPLGGWFAALGADGLVLYDAKGEPVRLPDGVDRPRAIAWSRDDALAAVADAAGLALFVPGPADRRPVRLDVQALDLAWGP